jgi:signal transduction histidine kinase
MRTGIKVFIILFCVAFLFSTGLVFAEKSPEDLAKETEDACAASAKTKPTIEMIVDKVNKACDLLAKEGKAAYPKFKGKDSEFIFAGTYIWIHDMGGVMRMHPIKFKLDGNSVTGLKDTKGKFLFVEFNKVAKEKGSGWVDYMWPKPGEKDPSRKVSYVKLVKTPDGDELVAGCGVYDLPDAEVDKLVSGK